VPNESFELYSLCPDNPGQIYRAIPWFQTWIIGNNVTISSSDYFNACSPTPMFTVPHNDYAGTQYAHTGNAYAGIALYGSSSGDDTREYIEVKLISPLQQGKKYCVEFYVSLADTSQFACDNISAYFTNDTLKNSPSMTLINANPQVTNTNGVITDKEGWTLITGEFIASGGESFLTIGNFKSNANTNAISMSGASPFAYYYIDDVSVILCDTIPTSLPPTESSIIIPNVFTPNSDGVNDVFLMETTAIESLSCEIFNRWGIKVATLNRGNEGWDGRTTSGQEAIEGIYYYVVRARNEKGEIIDKTGFIHLVR
jgi:gliding motility-associated-like protein